jgi:hypothetical protein
MNHDDGADGRHLPSRPLEQTAFLDRLQQHWRELWTELFDRDGLSELFTHARNVLTGTVIVAAGVYASRHDAAAAPGLWGVHVAGHGVALLGIVLLVLNLLDGLHKLSRRRHPAAWRLATFGLYLLVSLRLAQVTMFFRTPL